MAKHGASVGVCHGARVAAETLCVLDEPTVGLRGVDVARLFRVQHRLADGAHSAVVIAHDLDAIAEAEAVIDLGPECGVKAGASSVEKDQDISAWMMGLINSA